MTKTSGIGMVLEIDDAGGTARDVSTDFNTVQWSTPRGVADVTGLTVGAKEALLLLADFSISGNGTHDPGSNLIHAVLRTVPSTSVARTVTITVPGPAVLAVETLFSEYSLNRGADGSLTWSTSGQLANGVVPTWA